MSDTRVARAGRACLVRVSGSASWLFEYGSSRLLSAVRLDCRVPSGKRRGRVGAARFAAMALPAMIKRMKHGERPQADAPEPQSGLDPGCLETWQLELDICERVGRQLRCVGGALA